MILRMERCYKNVNFEDNQKEIKGLLCPIKN